MEELFNSLKQKFNYKNINYDLMFTEVSNHLEGDLIDNLIIYAGNKVFYHYEYGNFAGNLVVYKMHEKSKKDIYNVTNELYKRNLVSMEYYAYVRRLYPLLKNIINYDRDFKLNYFSIATLQSIYLLPSETPQELFLRVAISISMNKFKHEEYDDIEEDDDDAYEYVYRDEDGNIYEENEIVNFEEDDDIELKDKLLNDYLFEFINIKKTYDRLSNLEYIFATPTLINAGKIKNQMSSCFILNMNDSIESIMDTLADAAKISQTSGGLGINIHKIRPANSYIYSSNGYSSGIVKMLKMWDSAIQYVDQGGKRNGACAVYLEPWHMDIFEFVSLKLKTGSDDVRARSLFYALWVNDLFMERVMNDDKWTLFDSHHFPGLDECYGEKFNNLYTEYEKSIELSSTRFNDPIIFKVKPYKVIKARDLWEHILKTQIETGGPFILFKDSCNAKSNQKNLGTIKGSNLCTEIIEYSSTNETAVCNLASISLKCIFIPEDEIEKRKSERVKYDKHVKEVNNKLHARMKRLSDKDTDKSSSNTILDILYKANNENIINSSNNENNLDILYKSNNENKDVDGVPIDYFVKSSRVDELPNCSDQIDYIKLSELTKELVYNLNNILDSNYYINSKTKRSNMKNRPMGIGVQGMADLFALLNLNIDESPEVVDSIFKTIYISALRASVELAKIHGHYDSFNGSPASEGILQPDMWGCDKSLLPFNLRRDVVKYGLRNSLLLALMPTAGTAQILGNNEGIEPFTNNMYTRNVKAGQFQIINKYMVDDLEKLKLWNGKIRENIIKNKGSIQQISLIPDDIKKKYRTIWEMKKKPVIDTVANISKYICQSYSMTMYYNDPDINDIGNLLFYGWKKGLKTGMYYLRTRPAADPIQFTCTSCGS